MMEPRKEDAEYAAFLKAKAQEIATQLALLMDEAMTRQMMIQVQWGRDQFGKNIVSGLSVIKVLA